MRFYITIFLFCTLSLANAFGQIKLPAGKHKVNESTFNVGYTDIDVFVWNDKNVYPVPRPIGGVRPLAIRREDVRVDTLQQQKIIKEVVKSKLGVFKTDNQSIGLQYLFYPNGEVMNIIIQFPHDAPFTLKDIAEIDRRLRQELKATFRQRQLTYDNVALSV